MKPSWIFISIFVLSAFHICHGYKILGVFSTMAKSHHIVGSSLMKELAKRGHEVSVISPFPLKTPIKNYRDIPSMNVLEASKYVMDKILDMHDAGFFNTFQRFFNLGITITNTTLNEPSVQALIKSNEKFDLVIMVLFLNEAMLGFSSLFNAPVIGVSTFGASAWSCDLVGTPSPPSYVPHPVLGFSDHMTFIQRIGNLLLAVFDKIIDHYISMPKQVQMYEKNFPNPKPNLYDIRKNVSLVLLNNHFSISFPRPYVPNMIEVGGMHINRESKPLPANIKNILDNAKYGVIYFSLGSNLKSKILPKDKRDALLNTFKSMKQQILWKWEDKELPGKSDNIFISDWFPQDDILAHPNVKLFITHGGLLSTTEAVYHGVPIVGIPMFADQFVNMARSARAGFGLTVEYNTLTKESLSSAINEVLENKKYAENIKTVSERYRDQPMNPLDTAIYWVEYVIRHKGAPHMHSAGQDLSSIEYHNIDVLAVIGGSVFLVFYLLYAMICKVLSLFKSKPKKASEKKKKN